MARMGDRARWRARVVACALASLPAMAWGGASEGDRAMDRVLAQQPELRAGKVDVRTVAVAGSAYRRALAVGVIDAPPEAVWAVIEDCGRYAGRMPHMTASRVRARSGNTRECEVTIDLPAPLGEARLVTRAVDRVTPGVRWQRSWTLLEGDFQTNSGSWTLVPYQGDRTLAVYEIHVEPKLAVSPGLQKIAQQRSIPRLFARVGEVARR